MYPGSPFAQEQVTEDIFVSFVNPGKGTKITLTMAGSEINEELSETIFIGDQYSDTDTLTLRFPVAWKRQVLCHWRTDRSVDLRWDISFDDRPVETLQADVYLPLGQRGNLRVQGCSTGRTGDVRAFQAVRLR